MRAKLFAILIFIATSSLVFASVPIEKIHINKAEPKALVHVIPGIGEKRAEAIVQERNQHGAFKSINDLARVPGLGAGFVKKHLARLNEVFIVD